MSLGIVIKAPEGLVLAAESRITLGAQLHGQQMMYIGFDNATKLFNFKNNRNSIGVVTYGAASIGLRTAHSFTPEFEASLPEDKLTVHEFADKLSNFYLEQWRSAMPKDYIGPNMTFLIAGFDDSEPYGKIFEVNIPNNPRPIEQSQGTGSFGITWGGQREFVDRLIQGFDHRIPEELSKTLQLNEPQKEIVAQVLQNYGMQIPLAAMPLQDCIDLAIFFIRTTIDGQNLTVGIRGCGGFIDVATITSRNGFEFIQRKIIKGETIRNNK